MSGTRARMARGSGAPDLRQPQVGERPPRLNGDELVDFAEITEIELRILRRMKEYTLGDHGSVFHGTGVDFVGLRDWQAGDRFRHAARRDYTSFAIACDGPGATRCIGKCRPGGDAFGSETATEILKQRRFALKQVR